ncbi:hypothetical protein C666_12580 [Thauera linaloolentis 47Lol = DSM 12138]|uniref:Uncharacterized protein n=2 Tax=Thauera linaloolentis TaxID=76112 RepID=N6XY03_THAL4|nr:hypothetical protein C666_12580 [Thauera linaloolentis 47Lol = DSM 12138]
MSLDHLIRQKRWPNLKNPQWYSEKMLWRLVYDRREILSFTCDKMRMKEYAKSKVSSINVPKNLWVGFELDDIKKLSSLPADFFEKGWALKPNHSSGFCIIGKGVPDLNSINLKGWWKTYGSVGTAGWGGWAYGKAKKALVLEELIGDGSVDLIDYKFYVFGGKCSLLQIITGRGGVKRRYVLNRQWQLQYSSEDPQGIHLPPPPSKFGEMLETAEKLGEDFDFMRIDLYYHNDEIWFSELTPYPSMMRSSRNGVLNRSLGDSWKLPTIK